MKEAEVPEAPYHFPELVTISVLGLGLGLGIALQNEVKGP